MVAFKNNTSDVVNDGLFFFSFVLPVDVTHSFDFSSPPGVGASVPPSAAAAVQPAQQAVQQPAQTTNMQPQATPQHQQLLMKQQQASPFLIPQSNQQVSILAQQEWK